MSSFFVSQLALTFLTEKVILGCAKKTISCSEIWLNVELINGWNQKLKTRENMNRRRWNKREGKHLPRVRKMGIRRG